MIRLRSFFGVLGVNRATGRLRQRLLVSLVVGGLVGTTGLFLAAGASAAPTCTDTFDAADSGESWNTAGAWSSGTPTSTTVACWGSGITVIAAGSDTADAIEGGTLEIDGGTLDLTNSSDASSVGDVTMSGGILEGPSPLTINGSFTWTGQGELDANITQTDGSGTCFTLNGTGQAYFTGGSVSTSCQVTIDDTGTITTGGATVTTTSTIDFGAGVVIGQGDATFTAAGVVGPGSGTYGWAGGTLDLTSGSTTVAAGEALEAGAITFESGQTATIAATGEINQLNGTGQIESGAVVTGGGSLNVAGGTLTVDGGTPAGTLTAGMGASGGTLTIASGADAGTSSSALAVSDGTLNVNGATTVGNVTLSGGTFTGAAQLTVDGSFNWSAQATFDPNIVQSDGSGTCFNITGNTGQLYMTGGSVQTSCQVSIDNPGFITAGNASITTTSTLDFATGLQIPVNGGDNGIFTAAGVAANSGPSYGTGADSLVLTSGATTVAAGTTLESGTLTVEAGQTVTVDSTGALDETGGSGQIDAGGIVTGGGNLELTDGNLAVDDGGHLTSGVSVQNGTMTVDSGSTFGTSSSPTSVSGGNLVFDGPGTTGNVTLSGGAISGPAQLTVDGSFNWSAQATFDPNIVQSDGSGTCFNITGNTGQLYMTGGSVQTSCQVSIDNPGFITAGNASITTTSTLDFATGLQIPVNGGDNGIFTAAGVAANSGPSYGTGADSLVLTGGTTDVSSGNTLVSGPLSIEGSGTVLQDDGTVEGAPTLTSGGTLDGSGTVDNSVTNSGGTVAPGDGEIGILTVGGYTGSGSGTLEIDDSGPGTAGTNFSQLSVSGGVALGGVLEVEPTPGYASEASPDDTIPVIAHASGLSGTFASVTSTSSLQASETFSATYPGGGIVDAVVGAAQAPSQTAPPVLSGTAVQGDQLSVTTGTWSNGPNTFTYQWVDCPTTAGTGCTDIGGHTSSTYTLQASDVGKYVTVIVTAHNASNSAPTAQPTPLGPVLSSAPSNPSNPMSPPVTTPVEQTAPTVTGTSLPGDTLTCDPGTWTGSPTFSYQWGSNGSPIPGATSNTLLVTISDEGTAITCDVTASIGSSHVEAVTSGLIVAIAGTLTCPQPTGGVSGTTLGAWHLGMTKAQARKVSTFFTVTKFGFDRFCMYAGWGVRTGYASSLLVRRLPRHEAKSLVGRVVMILAANTHYAVDGISPGTALSSIPHTVKLSKPFKIGLNTWYLVKGASTTGVLKVAGGVAQEVGIANKQLTSGSAASQRTFLSTFRQG